MTRSTPPRSSTTRAKRAGTSAGTVTSWTYARARGRETEAAAARLIVSARWASSDSRRARSARWQPAAPRWRPRAAPIPEEAPTMIARSHDERDRDMGPDSSGPGRGLSNPRPGRRFRCGRSAEDRTDLAERAAHPELATEKALEV